jgi:hypothetical protein
MAPELAGTCLNFVQRQTLAAVPQPKIAVEGKRLGCVDITRQPFRPHCALLTLPESCLHPVFLAGQRWCGRCCETTNMSALHCSYRVNPAIEDEPLPTIGISSRRCCGSPVLVARGAICLKSLAFGTACTSALVDGHVPGYGTRYFPELAADAHFEEDFIDSTMVRAHQHAAGAPKKR